MSPIDKLVSNLSKRLKRYNPSTEVDRRERLNETRFAKLREGRAKYSVYTGYKAYEDAWVNMSKEEIDYYRSKITPEERYQTLKEIWYFHDTSSYMTGDTSTDRYGCNADACIPACNFFPKHGRIDVDGNVSH